MLKRFNSISNNENIIVMFIKATSYCERYTTTNYTRTNCYSNHWQTWNILNSVISYQKVSIWAVDKVSIVHVVTRMSSDDQAVKGLIAFFSITQKLVSCFIGNQHFFFQPMIQKLKLNNIIYVLRIKVK